jgi:hypothetical protein
MTQSVLDFTARDTHAENLRRCLANQAGAILEFFATRKPGDTYHGPDLTNFVKARVPAVAESPTRIQRALRKSGAINYRCIRRIESLYEVLAVKQKEAAN